MINPGRESNPVYPTGSGGGGPPQMNNIWGKQLVSVDGFSLTMGLLVALIVLWLVWQTWFTKRRR